MLTRLATLMFWRTLARACVVLSIVGAFLPVLPTTPFLLVALQLAVPAFMAFMACVAWWLWRRPEI